MTLRVPFRDRARSVVVLAAILAVAALFRFGGLATKPLWLDEVITALLCLGRGPADVPLGVAFPLSSVGSIFAAHPTATWRDVVARLVDPAIQHTHPPLFYVLSHAWLSWRQPPFDELAWTLRAVAAASGVLAVALTFGLARAAFGARVALITASMAAVSPLMVMLAQEARNYTLPLALVTAALWALVTIVNRLTSARPAPAALWALWAGLNVLACYAHYYGILAFAAQAATLGILTVRAGVWRQLGPLAASVAAVGVAFLPWAPILLEHAASPEQRWMRLEEPGAVFYNTLSAWQEMLTGSRWRVPVATVTFAAKDFALVFGLWVLVVLGRELGRRFRAAPAPPAAPALLLVLGITLVELFAASFVSGKDLVSQGRFHFAYFPAMIALFGWAVANLPARRAASWRRAIVQPARWAALSSILLVGSVNSLLTDVALEYPKPFRPDRVGAALAEATSPPVLVAIGSGSFHETVARLTDLIELSRRSPAVEQTRFAFVPRTNRYATYGRHFNPAIFWIGLAGVHGIANPPSTLWIEVAGLWPSEYPNSLEVSAADGERRRCLLDRRELARLDDDQADTSWRPPFRLYHCGPAGAAGS